MARHHKREHEDDDVLYSDLSLEHEDEEDITRRRYIRKKLETRLERKRMREDLDEFDGDFDWEEYDSQ